MASAAHVQSATGSRNHRFGLCLVILLGASLVVGCSKDTEPSSGATTSTPPAPTASAPTDPDAAEKKALKKVYAKFWEAQAEAYAKGSSKGTNLNDYATTDALVAAESDLLDLQQQGIVTRGKPTSTVSRVSVDMDRKTPSGRLTDCLDTEGWTFHYKDTGKQVPRSDKRILRYIAEVEAEKWGKQWMITKVTPSKRKC
ncbi:hypothetical protein [Streptomyces sp. KLOTTS4A1]|uniref:hypothetical protein n=1 Tax=Streptomyces sp. KLOTTS4A1 TaxID=3390996 RepID=UPI0039F51875